MKKLLLMLPFIGLFFFASCEKDDDDPVQSSTGNTTLPATVAGTDLFMKFTAPQAGAPYVGDQIVKFTFSSSGSLGIDTNPDDNDGDEITIASFTQSGEEYIWTDNTNGFSYNLSLKDDDSVNEINVFTVSDNDFLGQFIPVEDGGGDNTSLVANYEGTYTVTSVDHGTHSRMTVSIDANGNIDFDSGLELNASDFALVSDKLECCDGIWIDMNPYPQEPYKRVNLFVDNTSKELIKIEYLPEYPGIGNRVTVNLTKGTSGGGNDNELTVSGDFSKVGGATYSPDMGEECTSCASSEKYTWTQNESAGPDRVFSVEIINATGMVILDFSASSAFAASSSDLASLGIVHDQANKSFTFTNVAMNERFSQPGAITLNGKLTYE